MSDATCSLGDCDRPHYAKGYCRPHYFRWSRFGDPLAGTPIRRRKETRGTCSVKDCHRPHYCQGWCQSHYNRWKKHGDVRSDIPVESRNSRNGTCRVRGCDRPIRRRLLCNAHGRRERLFGDVMAHIPLREVSNGKCSVPGCERPYSSRSWCHFHYQPFRLYKLTPDDYDVLLARQGGGCAICGAAPSDKERLHVDHDHACCPARKRSCGRCVRGLLCNACNHMLGNANDDTDRLRRAIGYLEAWQQRLQAVV